ncbi:MAG: 6-pyruvoyl tetrahydropterin synthase family protein [Candidatus Thorarchaeota archaeon]
MYRVEKTFSLPIGHRLSKHKGRCFSFHGHNFTVKIGVKSETLDENDMIIDFSNLKAVVEGYLDKLDHCTLLNVSDKEIADQLSKIGTRVILISSDPTAEKLSEYIYKAIEDTLNRMYPLAKMDYVTVYENENSKATYSEE